MSVIPIIVEKLENKIGKMESQCTKKKSLKINHDSISDIVFPVESKVGEKRLPMNVSMLSWTKTLQS